MDEKIDYRAIVFELRGLEEELAALEALRRAKARSILLKYLTPRFTPAQVEAFVAEAWTVFRPINLADALARVLALAIPVEERVEEEEETVVGLHGWS